MTGEVCDYVTEENYVFTFDDSLREKVVQWATREGTVLPKQVKTKLL